MKYPFTVSSAVPHHVPTLRQRSLHERLYVPLERDPGLPASILTIIGKVFSGALLAVLLLALFYGVALL